MNSLIAFITTAIISFNVISSNINTDTNSPRIIDAFTLAYNTIYTEPEIFDNDYIILDMESIYFVDTTYEERQNLIQSFDTYQKITLNASLFKLQEIGLADKLGQLKIDGVLLMINNIKPNEENGLIIEGTKWIGPIAANFYRLELKVENNKWVLKKIDRIAIA